jgi:glutathione synthase/RimK-type ligase-like ATP-grasp enzyme
MQPLNMYDITLLTDARYLVPKEGDWYTANILLEDKLLREALERRGLRIHRTHWDDPHMDWTQTRYALFRTTWDYFDRFPEFSAWLDRTAALTKFLNPLPLVHWNLDKHYLRDLNQRGIPIPPTKFIEIGEQRSLAEILLDSGWNDAILKPAISGSARHTYRINLGNTASLEGIFKQLVADEAMLLQEFQNNILTRGEATFMVFGGKFTHAILKRAKTGDFRVQDDFGGSVHPYQATKAEQDFAERVVATSPYPPAYARVDVMWDNAGEMCLSELEMIEPELWMREFPASAEAFADALMGYLD